MVAFAKLIISLGIWGRGGVKMASKSVRLCYKLIYIQFSITKKYDKIGFGFFQFKGDPPESGISWTSIKSCNFLVDNCIRENVQSCDVLRFDF